MVLLFKFVIYFLRHHKNHHQLEWQFGWCQTKIEFERLKNCWLFTFMDTYFVKWHVFDKFIRSFEFKKKYINTDKWMTIIQTTNARWLSLGLNGIAWQIILNVCFICFRHQYKAFVNLIFFTKDTSKRSQYAGYYPSAVLNLNELERLHIKEKKKSETKRSNAAFLRLYLTFWMCELSKQHDSYRWV